MHLLACFLFCLLGWLVLPRAFKFVVGVAVGLSGGGLAWAIAAMFFASLVTLHAFAAFMALGIAGGIAIAFRG